MVARASVRRTDVLAVLALAALLLLGGPRPAHADGLDVAPQSGEAVEAGAGGGVSPSGTAGLSLLAAAVVATFWNVAVGERRSGRAR